MPRKNIKPSNSDLIELLSSLAARRVKFLIVGGYAVSKHSEPRFTKHVDIWIENSQTNARKVYEVLNDFGAPLSTIGPEFFTADDHFLKLGREPLRVDIICGMRALEFRRAWKNRVRGTLFGVGVNFISVKDLIVLKRDAARPQDLADIDILKRYSRSKLKKRRGKSR